MLEEKTILEDDPCQRCYLGKMKKRNSKYGSFFMCNKCNFNYRIPPPSEIRTEIKKRLLEQ